MRISRQHIEYLVTRCILCFLLLLPRKLCLLFGKLLGSSFYFLDRKHRKIALTNLKTAFYPQLPESTLKKIALKSFSHLGMAMLDLVKFSSLSQEKKDKLIKLEGKENLVKALEQGKGVLIFSAHYGSWEIASYPVSKLAHLNVIARPLDNELLEKELLKIRKALGVQVIYKHKAAKSILQSLRRKEMVAILIDQNVLRSQAVFVDFFGKQAATTPSLAAFYLRTGAPIVPVFCYLAPGSVYCLKILPPLDIELSGNYDQDVLKITQICTKIIEAQVKEIPYHWFWFHNRWKTRPVKAKIKQNESNQTTP